jgi:hypothetical protein
MKAAKKYSHNLNNASSYKTYLGKCHLPQKASSTGLSAVRGTLLQSLLQGSLHMPNGAPQSKFQSKIPSSFNFLIPCSLFNIPNKFMSIRRPEA